MSRLVYESDIVYCPSCPWDGRAGDTTSNGCYMACPRCKTRIFLGERPQTPRPLDCNLYLHGRPGQHISEVAEAVIKHKLGGLIFNGVTVHARDCRNADELARKWYEMYTREKR